MRIPAPLFAVGAAAAIVISGCSMHGSSVAPTSGSGLQSVITHPDYKIPTTNVVTPKLFTDLLSSKQNVTPDTGCGTGALLYVSQYYTSDVQIYKQAGKSQSPCSEITTNMLNPQGIFVVAKTGDVWVANTGDSNVVELKKGSTKIIKTLSDSGEYPVDVCVDTNGNVYASNIITTAGGAGSVTEWIKGTGKGKTLAIANNTKVLFCALDNKHNLYVNYISSSTGAGAMVEFVGGKGTAKVTKVTSEFPGAMQFDKTQDLNANDQEAFTTCNYELPNPKGKCFTVPGVSDLLGLRFTPTNAHVYEGDAAGGSVYEFSYPGWKLLDTISAGLGSSSPPFGVAVDPGAAL